MEKNKEALRQKRICRLCLTEKEPLSSIFDKTKNKRNAAVSLALQIMNCFSIEVVPSDGRPSLICDICRHFVEQSYAFKQLCREADELLMLHIQQGDALEPVEWPQHLTMTYEAITKYQVVTKKLDVLTKEKETKEKNCEKCVVLQNQLQSQKRISIIHICKICNKKFFTKSGLGRHSKVHVRRSCLSCGKEFIKDKDLRAHIQTEHNSSVPLQCVECLKEFVDKVALKTHERLHRKFRQKIIKCCHCQNRCMNRSALNKHLEMLHWALNPFACEYCKEAFPSMYRLKRHLTTHSANRPLPCKYCPKTFIKPAHYKKHVSVSHNIRKKSYLVKSYRCLKCKKDFPYQVDLAHHMAMHTSQNLQCPLCKECFTDINTVTEHLKKHIEGDQFMCDMCDLVFTSEFKLEQHFMHDHREQIKKEQSQDDMESKQTTNGEVGKIAAESTTTVGARIEPQIRIIDLCESKPPPTIIKKAEEMKLKLNQMKTSTEIKRKISQESNDKAQQPPVKKATPQPSDETTAVEAKSLKGAEVVIKPAEKSLLLLEKDLHELKRASKAKKADEPEEDKGSFTPTPKPGIQKKKAVPAAKTPSEKTQSEKTKTPVLTKDKQETPKTATRPSRTTIRKNYARMARANSTDTSEDEEEYKVTSSAKKKKVDVPAKKKVETPKETPTTETKRRGRPRKQSLPDAKPAVAPLQKGDKEQEQQKEVPAKKPAITKAEEAVTSDAQEAESITSADEQAVTSEAKSDDSQSDANKQINKSRNTPEKQIEVIKDNMKSPTVVIQNTSPKKSPNIIVTPEGKKLMQIPASVIKSLPLGMKPRPIQLPLNSQISTMKIGQKTVKVQKFVMSKAEVEAMTKQGMVEFKDGTMVLKQGIKLPTVSPLKILSSIPGEKKILQASPSKVINEPPKPTRCSSPPGDV